MTVVLEGMSPAQEQGWLVLLDLFRDRRADWTLIGGQMMFLLAVENGVTMPRTTTDMDVVINVVESPGAIQAFASQLLQEGFEFGDVSPAGTGGRFTKPADPGPGSVMFDVLAPEGLGERTDITTVRPARTVQVPGSRQALDRSQPVTVRVRESEGVVRRPSLLGALVVKAAATAIAVRSNPERDWEVLRSCSRWFPTRSQHVPNVGERTYAVWGASAPCSPMTIAPGDRWGTRNAAWAEPPFGCCSAEPPAG